MTVAEAKAVFGLREEDTITEDGMDRLRGCVASLQKQTVSRRSKQECQRDRSIGCIEEALLRKVKGEKTMKEIKVTVFYNFNMEEGDENRFATEADAEAYIKYIEQDRQVVYYLYEVIEWIPSQGKWNRLLPQYLIHKEQRVFGVTTSA